MTEVLLGLRSNLSFAGWGAATYASSRAKLLGLLFDHVLVEAGTVRATPLREQISVRRQRAAAPGRIFAPWDPGHAACEPGELCAGFDGLIGTLRILRSDWGGAYISPPDTRPDEDVIDALEAGRVNGSVGGWLRAQLAVDMTIARRMRAALAPGVDAAAEMATAGGVDISTRAAVCPDPGRVPWEQVEALRTTGTMLAVRRLVHEMLSIARRPDSDTSLSTFDELGQDVGDLLWDVLADAGHEPRAAFTMRLAVPAYDCAVPWTAVLLAPHSL